MTSWHADGPEALEAIGGGIHDAGVDIADVHHDEATRALAVPFAQEWGWGPMLDDPDWRHAPKPELLKTTWRYREERVPFMRGTLRIAEIESCTLDPRAGDAAMLTDLRTTQSRASSLWRA